MPVIRTFTTAEAPPDVLPQIRRLVDSAFAGEFSDDDWAHTLGGWHVVAMEGAGVLAHAAVIERALEIGGRSVRTGYVEGVATAPGRQGEGHGSLVMAELAAVIQRHFSMGALSTGEHHFYERLGWLRWRGPSYVRHGAQLVRTEDEDDGIMVLLFDAATGIDLTASIACDARSGDDW